MSDYIYKGSVDFFEDLPSNAALNDAYLVKYKLINNIKRTLNKIFVYDGTYWYRETISIIETDDPNIYYNYKGALDYYEELSILESVKDYDAYKIRYDIDTVTGETVTVNDIYYYTTENGWNKVIKYKVQGSRVLFKKKINDKIYELYPKSTADNIYTSEYVLGTSRHKTVEEKLNELETGTVVYIDETLSEKGMAADAKAVGDRFKEIEKITNNTEIMFSDYLNLFNKDNLQTGKYINENNIIEIDPSGSTKRFVTNIIPLITYNKDIINKISILVPSINPNYTSKLIKVVTTKIDTIEGAIYTRVTIPTPINYTINGINYACYNLSLADKQEYLYASFDCLSDSDTDVDSYKNNIVIVNTVNLTNEYSNYIKNRVFTYRQTILDPTKVDISIQNNIELLGSIDIKSTDGTDIIDVSSGKIFIGNTETVSEAVSTIEVGKKSTTANKLNYGIKFMDTSTYGLFSVWHNDTEFLRLSTSNDVDNFVTGNNRLVIGSTNGSYLNLSTTNGGLSYTLNTFNTIFRDYNATVYDTYTITSENNLTLESNNGSVILKSDLSTLDIGSSGVVINTALDVDSFTIRGVPLADIISDSTDLSGYLPTTGGTITGNLTVNGIFTGATATITNLSVTESASFTGSLYSINSNNSNKFTATSTNVKLQALSGATELKSTVITSDNIVIKDTTNNIVNTLASNNIVLTSGNLTNTIDAGGINITDNSNSFTVALNNGISAGITSANTLSTTLNANGDNTFTLSSNTGTSTLVTDILKANSIELRDTSKSAISINKIQTAEIIADTVNPVENGFVKIDHISSEEIKVSKVTDENNSYSVVINKTNGIVITEKVSGTTTTLTYKDGVLTGSNWSVDANGDAVFNTVTATSVITNN